MLPTPAAAAFMTNWSSLAVEGIKENQDDQQNVQRLNNHAYHCCQNSGCFGHVRNQVCSGHWQCSMAAQTKLTTCSRVVGYCQPLKRRNARPSLQMAKDNKDGQAAMLRTLLSGLAMVTDDRCLLTRPDAPLVEEEA